MSFEKKKNNFRNHEGLKGRPLWKKLFVFTMIYIFMIILISSFCTLNIAVLLICSGFLHPTRCGQNLAPQKICHQSRAWSSEADDVERGIHAFQGNIKYMH